MSSGSLAKRVLDRFRRIWDPIEKRTSENAVEKGGGRAPLGHTLGTKSTLLDFRVYQLSNDPNIT